MSALEDVAVEVLGSLALLSRKTGIDEKTLRDFANGDCAPDTAHAKRIEQVLQRPLPDDAFPHQKPDVSCLDVTEARVLAVREELLVRPHMVKKDDLVRLVEAQKGSGERLAGWVKAQEDAQFVRADLVRIKLKDGSTAECNPAQIVTVARRRAPKEENKSAS